MPLRRAFILCMLLGTIAGALPACAQSGSSPDAALAHDEPALDIADGKAVAERIRALEGEIDADHRVLLTLISREDQQAHALRENGMLIEIAERLPRRQEELRALKAAALASENSEAFTR